MENEEKRYTVDEILNDERLLARLFRLSNVPHEFGDGNIYVPPRRIQGAMADRAKDLMAAVGVKDILQLTDLAFNALDWMVDRRLDGEEIGSVNAHDDFAGAGLAFIDQIDPGGTTK